MKGYNIAIALAIFFSLVSIVTGEYWFQFGAVGGTNTAYNSGASAEIKTAITHNISTGSISFWIGETLNNGVFVQIGYLESNESGRYPTVCTANGCSNYEYSNASQAEWFYEYFPGNYSGSQFIGAIGPPGSAGKNGTLNDYAFYALGNTWYFLFNGNIVGSVDTHAGSSGFNAPIAFGELANASNNRVYINNATFTNFDVYKDGHFLPVSEAYSYIGYGAGSKTTLHDPYGVEEANGRVNYFAAGSGLPQPANYTQLWGFGYILKISSAYGSPTKTAEYSAYSSAPLSVPSVVYINNNTRAVFKDWIGSGIGSYTGSSNSTTVYLESNVTEKAEWILQYRINVYSRYGTAYGSGWYDSGSTITYGVIPALVYQNASSRTVFSGWSTGITSPNASAYATAPLNISAIWLREFLINLTTPYGNVTGNGWHIAGSSFRASLDTTIVNISKTQRLAFYSWSNGSSSPNLNVYMLHPVKLNAIFREQYLTTIDGIDPSGTTLWLSDIHIGTSPANNTLFLYGNKTYNVSSVVYKGTKMEINSDIRVNSSSITYIKIPVQDISIKTIDIFGIPVNASVALTFPNGTTLSTYSGPTGRIGMADVPYGKANAVVRYLGLTSRSALSNSGSSTFFFLSLVDIEVFVSVGILAFIIHEISRRYLHKKHLQYISDKAAYR